jgi:U4/U6 small nuclear ribonucleoprotein PRP31
MKTDILRKLEKAQEPPPARLDKSLPKPDLEHKKKRGGKKFRKARERRQMSDARKAANRMGFADVQEDMYQDEGMGGSLGSLGKSTGHFGSRETKTNNKGGTISKKMKQRLAQQQQRNGTLSTMGRGGGGSGTASVAFTPLQGLEIQVAHKKRKVDGKTQYFGRSSFHNVAEGK